jgi:excinuclease ABC subunit C
MIKSDLDRIKGIGPRTKEILLKHFGSVEKISSAPPEELEKIIGQAKSAILSEYFRN